MATIGFEPISTPLLGVALPIMLICPNCLILFCKVGDFQGATLTFLQ